MLFSSKLNNLTVGLLQQRNRWSHQTCSVPNSQFCCCETSARSFSQWFGLRDKPWGRISPLLPCMAHVFGIIPRKSSCAYLKKKKCKSDCSQREIWCCTAELTRCPWAPQRSKRFSFLYSILRSHACTTLHSGRMHPSPPYTHFCKTKMFSFRKTFAYITLFSKKFWCGDLKCDENAVNTSWKCSCTE